MNTLAHYQEALEQNFRIAYLIGHFIQETITEEEETELEEWIQQSDANMQVFEDLTGETMVTDFMQWYYQRNTERNLQEVKQRLSFSNPLPVISFWRYAAVASIVLLLGTGIYFFGFYHRPPNPPASSTISSDIAPGEPSATLILANGQSIHLNNIKDTMINAQVHIKDGVVIYKEGEGEPQYHELSIPRKGFYQLLLPDGSRAWINSSSSIRYPSRFTGTERRVSVTGETYFEVAKDAVHPFIVSVNGIHITAVGTAFNINAYPNENGLRATLTEGKIKVDSSSTVEYLIPGQQVTIQANQWIVSTVETSPVIAWTRNQFTLKNTPLEEVLRMVERWYDAKIVYEDKITDHFTGTIDRSVPVSQLLKLLSATGAVHFRIDGTTIIVSH